MTPRSEINHQNMLAEEWSRNCHFWLYYTKHPKCIMHALSHWQTCTTVTGSLWMHYCHTTSVTGSPCSQCTTVSRAVTAGPCSSMYGTTLQTYYSGGHADAPLSLEAHVDRCTTAQTSVYLKAHQWDALLSYRMAQCSLPVGPTVLLYHVLPSFFP